jgi:hypothetical protein
MGHAYRRPPITEAVIEVRFGEPVSNEVLDRVDPHFAGQDEQLTNYAMQVVLPVAGGAYSATLNSATVPSPIIGHQSFIVDIDISREYSLPRRLDALMVLLEEAPEPR